MHIILHCDSQHSLWQVGVLVYTAGTDVKPAEIAKQGLAEAKRKNIDVVIMDTAGRLQVWLFYTFDLINLDHSFGQQVVLCFFTHIS